MKMTKRGFLTGVAAAIALTAAAGSATAATLLEKAKAGEPIRIGFANEVPWAYPGENNAPLGFANAHAVGVLTEHHGLYNRMPAHEYLDFFGQMYGLEKAVRDQRIEKLLRDFNLSDSNDRRRLRQCLYLHPLL